MTVAASGYARLKLRKREADESAKKLKRPRVQLGGLARGESTSFPAVNASVSRWPARLVRAADILMDEPLSALDKQLRERMQRTAPPA